MIAANDGIPLSLDGIYAKQPSFIEANNGRVEDAGLIVDLLTLGTGAISKAAWNLGVRFISTAGDFVLLEAETAVGRAAMQALVIQGRASLDESGRFLVKRGDPQASKILGDFGERQLADELGIAFRSAKQSYMVKLTDGKMTRREIDAVHDGIAYEAKAGVNATLTTDIRQQIDGDLYLLSQRRGDGVQWNFYQGVDPKLLDYLSVKGITYKVKP